MGCGASAAAEPPSDPAGGLSQPQAEVVGAEEHRAVAPPADVETAAVAPTRRADEGPAAQKRPEALTGGVPQAGATDSDEEPEPQTESDEDDAPATSKATTVSTGSALSEEEIAAIAQAAASSVVPGPQAGDQAVVGRRASVSVAMGESGAAAAAAAAAAESIPE